MAKDQSLPTPSSDAAFDAWRDSLPVKHWARYDLSACRLGWDAGRRHEQIISGCALSEREPTIAQTLRARGFADIPNNKQAVEYRRDDKPSDAYEQATQRSLEERIAELPTDAATLAKLLERRQLLELLAWDNCPEWVALRRSLDAASQDLRLGQLATALRWCVSHEGECLGDHPMMVKQAKAALAAASTPSSAGVSSIDMLMFCPKCGAQHVDRADEAKGWTNPPHATHTCQFCGLLWRPSNANTNGVAGLSSTEAKHVERFMATDPRTFAHSARTSITPEWREQWSIFLKDYNRYVDGDQKMPFSLLRDSMAAFVAETDQMLRAERCAKSGHVWVGIGDEGRSVCDDCGIDKDASPDRKVSDG